jgi:uncharacterized protein YbaA (DUF1428 family)
MTEHTEAQRLADRLDLYATGDKHQKDIEDAAAELRRLDAELMRKSDAIQRLWAERDSLRASTAHCDRCGKRLGDEGDIHTCSPRADPIGDAQDRLIAELAAQPAPVQKPVATMRMLHTYGDTTPPAAAHMTEFEEAVAAVDNTLHHAIDHWQDKASEQAVLLRECRFAIDTLIEKKPALAMLLCGSTTLGNLKASLHDYRVKGIFDATPPAAQPESVQPVSMYEDWYDSNSCSHCGMVGGHVKTCRHYTTPPAAQRQPLTDEEMWRLWNAEGNDAMNQQEAITFARAIEAAHGIKENT